MLVLPVPCLFDNFSYLLVCEVTRACAIIDPSEYYPVVTTLSEHQLRPQAIFCTHHHRDHIDGIKEILEEYPELPVYGHESEQGRIPELTHPLVDQEVVKVGQLRGEVHHTPGHTRGSCLYHFGDTLFTGDTLFGAGCGRIFEGTAEEMYHSLTRIIESFAPEVKIYPGHDYTRANLEFARSLEPANNAVTQRLEQERAVVKTTEAWTPSDLALELATNPFLRCDKPAILLASQNIEPDIDGTPGQVFRVIRRMKDNA